MQLYATNADGKDMVIASVNAVDTAGADVTLDLTADLGFTATPKSGTSVTVTVNKYTDIGGGGTKYFGFADIPRGWDISNAAFSITSITSEVFKLSSTDPEYTAQSVINRVNSTPFNTVFTMTGLVPSYAKTAQLRAFIQDDNKDPDTAG